MLIIYDLENWKKYVKKQKQRFSGSGGLEPPKRIYQYVIKQVSEEKIMQYMILGQKSYFNRGI
jgi:hypothetical protein